LQTAYAIQGMKKILLCSLVLFAGCGFFERKIAGYTGYSEMCIDGVSYIQFTSGASVKYGKDGRVALCD
jgi:hypothetical protein